MLEGKIVTFVALFLVFTFYCNFPLENAKDACHFNEFISIIVKLNGNKKIWALFPRKVAFSSSLIRAYKQKARDPFFFLAASALLEI